MKTRILNGLAAAALVAGGLVVGLPAQAQTQDTVWCNPVIGWGNTPVRTASGGYAIHKDSYPCPATVVSTPAPALPTLQPEYLVFFDWDKSNITPAADKVLADIVTALNRNQSARIQVVGHTDTSGAPAYNQRLSMRRAESIKSALVAKGVPASAIMTEGRGETQLLVQTGANVREPSNRRGQIIPRVSGPTS